MIIAAPPGVAAAQVPATLPPIEVVGVAPLLGSGVALERVPANVQSLSDRDIAAGGGATLGQALDRRLGGVSLSDTQGNPFQPDVSLRGFTASPILGTPAGLAVYQNGVRLNEPFGDVVQWDLVPAFAVRRLQAIPGANPVFGLNALGGAVALEMKTGFSFVGSALEGRGGSFGRRQFQWQDGRDLGTVATYLGLATLHEDGWRQRSPSDLTQAHADVSARRDGWDLGLSLTAVASELAGNGPAPGQLLGLSRAAVFTTPDATRNRALLLAARGGYEAGEGASLQASAYVRRLRRSTSNGDAADFVACTADARLLCRNVGAPGETTLTDLAGVALAVGAGNGTVGGTRTDTTAYGLALQGSLDRALLGLRHTGILGASLDQGDVAYRARAALGLLTGDRSVVATGIGLGGDAFNTELGATNRYLGLYATDTVALTEALDLMLAGRLNLAHVALDDRLGGPLGGSHDFTRFNPALGLTWRPWSTTTLYATYGEANRTPTAAEFACADPSRPCRFPTAFQADPPLRQVVSRAIEVGARGGGERLAWSAALFGSRNYDDILFVSAGPVVGSGYFANVGITQRAGGEFGLQGREGPLAWFASLAVIRATFASHLTIRSPNHPLADGNGDIAVAPGDRIPGLPLQSAKLGALWAATERWDIGIEAALVSNRVLRGDESNQLAPIAGYAVINLMTAYRPLDGVELIARADNLLDRRYATSGLVGDPTPVFPGFTDARFVTPAPPLGVWVGVRLRL